MLRQSNIQELRNLDMEIAKISHKAFSSGSEEKNLFIPTSANLKSVRAQVHALFEDVEKLDVSHSIIDVLSSHFRDFLIGTQVGLTSLVEDPGKAYHMLGAKINGLCLVDHRHVQVRHEVLMANLNAMHLIWDEAIKPDLDTYDDLKLAKLQSGLAEAHSTISSAASRLRSAFRGFKRQHIYETKNALKSVLEDIEDHIRFINAQFKDLFGLPAKKTFTNDDALTVNKEEYRRNLRNSVGVDLDEVLSWYEDENEMTSNEVMLIATQLDGNVKTTGDASKLLFKHAGPKASHEEMFACANEYLALARKAAHENIWLPQDEVCELVPIPKHLRDFYPWGGYMGDYPSRYPLYNRMFLNDHNYNAITDGWLKTFAIHEAYPGHHAQFIRSAIDPIPETMKRGASAVAFIEGTCLRSERVFEYVFADDPYFPLMVALRRHHASTRIKVDLMLHCFGSTIGEACEVYEKEMGFDATAARAQVQAHEHMQGYFTSYYYGLKKIRDIEKELGFEVKAFTELLFSVGRVNLRTFEKIAKLSPHSRHSLLHDFGSRLQFA